MMQLERYRKVVILDYSSMGKTSLLHQFVEEEFLECYDYMVKSTYNKMLMVGKDEFHLQIVDIAGQEVKTDEDKKLADSCGAVFLESSAKDKQMAHGIFNKIIKEIDRVENSYGNECNCLLM